MEKSTSRWTMPLAVCAVLALSLSGVANASSSCSIACPRGKCSIKLVEAGPLGTGADKSAAGREVIIRYAYADPLDLERFGFDRQEQAAIDTLAARGDIEKALPTGSAMLDALAAAIEAGDGDGVRNARHAIRRAYRAADLEVPAFASVVDEEYGSPSLAKSGVDCYCDSGGYPVCEKI